MLTRRTLFQWVSAVARYWPPGEAIRWSTRSSAVKPRCRARHAPAPRRGSLGRPRGFLELLDEANCYINGLGAIAAIADQAPYGISGRDGAVAFLYYVQLYLRRARTVESQLYATMKADAALIGHVKIQWLRTHFFLLFADLEPHVGIRDDEIRALLYAEHNLTEIADFIGRCVDASNCLCD